MTETRFTELLAKKLAGEATQEELYELESYLTSHPEDQYFQELLSVWWSGKNDTSETVQATPEDHFQYIIQKASEQSTQDIPMETESNRLISKHFSWIHYAVAASFIGVISFSIYFFTTGPSTDELAGTIAQENEIVAKKGTKSKLLLPDGTQVWLNSDTKLVYKSDFNDSLREVSLEGEAYFDVVKNPKKPFIVHTSGISIRVLGTAFNVKSYPQESFIEATLVRGLIEVERNSEPHASKILLRPNEKLTYSKPLNKIDGVEKVGKLNAITSAPVATLKAQSIEISSIPRNITDSTRLETSWVYGKLLFEGDSFRDLAQKMERWFNVKISFKNNKVAGYRFRGVFADENIEEALNALEMTNPFKYTINGNEIVIDKK